MTGLSRDREEDVPECSGREISWIFLGKIWFPGNGIRERRPLKKSAKTHGNASFATFSKKRKGFMTRLRDATEPYVTLMQSRRSLGFKLQEFGPKIKVLRHTGRGGRAV